MNGQGHRERERVKRRVFACFSHLYDDGFHSRVLVEKRMEEIDAVGGDFSRGIAQLVDEDREEAGLLLRLGLQQRERGLHRLDLQKLQIVLGQCLQTLHEFVVQRLDAVFDVVDQQEPLILRPSHPVRELLVAKVPSRIKKMTIAIRVRSWTVSSFHFPNIWPFQG